MDRDDFAVLTYAERRDLRGVVDRVNSEPWPEFMFHDLV